MVCTVYLNFFFGPQSAKKTCPVYTNMKKKRILGLKESEFYWQVHLQSNECLSNKCQYNSPN